MTILSFVREVYGTRKLGLKATYIEQLEATARLVEAFGCRSVANISDDLVCRFLGEYAKQHAAATVNSKRRALLTLWRAAHRLGYHGTPPGDIPRLPEPRRLPEAWTVAEVERLLATARQLDGHVGEIPRRHWWPALILACYDTGGRITAVRSLATEDYQPGERCMIIRGEHQKTGLDQLYWLSDQTVAAISPIYDRARPTVFTWPYGARYLWRYFRRIVESAGLRSSRRGMDLFHRLRRTNLSYCAAASLDLAQQQAGHADSRTTQRHYIDPRIAHTRSAVDVLPRPC